MFDKIKIIESVFLGFLSVIAMSLGISISNIINVKSVEKHTLNEIRDDRFPKLIALKNIVEHAMLANADIRTLLTLNDPKKIEETITSIQKRRMEISEHIAQIDKTISTKEGRELFNNAMKNREVLFDNFDVLYKHIRAKNKELAANFFFTEMDATISLLIEDMRKFEILQEEIIEKSFIEGHGYFEELINITIIFSIIMILTAIIATYVLLSNIHKKIELAIGISEKIAHGDFSENPQANSAHIRTELGRLLKSQEVMRTNLIQTIAEVRESAEEVSKAAIYLDSASHQVSNTTQTQADATRETSTTLEQLSVSIDHISSNAQDASTEAIAAKTLAEKGSNHVNEAVDHIGNVNQSVQHTSTEMRVLQKDITSIGNIITVIREVADQTNLLALNAAIEAARAGESGRGFAVVADEVKKLAERTTSSAQEITNMIHTIQKNTTKAAESMESSEKNTVKMTESANIAGAVIQEVQSSVEGAQKAINTIDDALKEQRIGAQEIAKTMDQIAQMSEQNTNTVKDLTTTSRSLLTLSENLKSAVGRFHW